MVQAFKAVAPDSASQQALLAGGLAEKQLAKLQSGEGMLGRFSNWEG